MRAATNTDARHTNRTKATGTHRDPGRSNGNRRAIAAVAVRPTAAPAQAVTGIALGESAAKLPERDDPRDKLRIVRLQIVEDPRWTDDEDLDRCVDEFHVLCSGDDDYDELVRVLTGISANAADRYAAELRAAAGAGASKGRGESGAAVQKGTSSK